MPLSEDEKDRLCGTVWQIASSEWVERFIIGFTGRSLSARFKEYVPQEYEHAVLLSDKMTREDALDLEEWLFLYMQESKNEPEDQVVYEKYDERRRDKPYRRSYGGRGDADILGHSVYMAWWSPYSDELGRPILSRNLPR